LFRLSKQHHQLTLALIIFSLLFNSIVTLAAASLVARQAQQYADSDAILICGGSSYRWVSLSHFEATGEFKPIETPENAKNANHPIKCANTYLADLGSDDMVDSDADSGIRIDLSDGKFAVIDKFVTVRNYLIPTSRAPPPLA
jgi:hypothetical protein